MLKSEKLLHGSETHPRSDQQACLFGGGQVSAQPEFVERGDDTRGLRTDAAAGPEEERHVAGAAGPYPDPPTPMQLEEIRRIIRKTGQPELVPTISWSKPDRNVEHRLIHPKSTVDRKSRPDGAMVPCSLCSGENPKCLSFYLLWSADGYLRVIGHFCGPKYFGEHEFRDMERAASRAARKEANENFLLNNLPNFHLWIAELDALAPVCGHAQNLSQRFMREVPSLHNELRRMFRDHGGALVILREREKAGVGPTGIRSSLGGGESEYDAIPVANLRGKSFLTPGYNPISKLSKIRRSFEMITDGRGPVLLQDDVLEIVCPLDENGLDRLVIVVREAHRHALRLVERLHEMAGFLSNDNLDGLDQWGGHEENELKFTVERGPRGVSFRVNWQEKTTLEVGEGIRPPMHQHLGSLEE